MLGTYVLCRHSVDDPVGFVACLLACLSHSLPRYAWLCSLKMSLVSLSLVSLSLSLSLSVTVIVSHCHCHQQEKQQRQDVSYL